MKGKVWATAWAILCASWIYDFTMLFYGIDGSKVVQGCAYIIVAMWCLGNCIESLDNGGTK